MPAGRFRIGKRTFERYLFDSLGLLAGDRVLHIGAGTGYYTAIMSEVVGPRGRVVGIEADGGLAARADKNLADRTNVTVVADDGCAYMADTTDVIVVNAGVTHPQPHWLDILPVGGRLLLPPTSDHGAGIYLKVVRFDRGYAAQFVAPVQIYEAVSGRDSAAEKRLKKAFRRTRYPTAAKLVNSLRRDRHKADDTCWLHGPGFCLSKTVVSDETL